MPLDINDFREYKGGNPEKIRESQRRRFASVELVDEIIQLDTRQRELIGQKDQKNKEVGQLNKKIGELKKNKQDAGDLIPERDALKATSEALEKEIEQLEGVIKSKVAQVGNYVADDVPFSNDEDKDNKIVKTWGKCEEKAEKLYHHQLLHMIGGYDPERGVKVVGARGYFLKGVGVLLNQALINFGLGFLYKKGFIALQPPYFMKQSVMAETAQLSQFDEELYKVPSDSKDNEDSYLIATSEQPISSFHRGEWLQEKDLPLRYVGYSTCFRKEAGSAGRNVWGIFRVHQFEKIEQFCITEPEKSWEMHEEMLAHSEEFLQTLGLPYRVISIVSGALNNAAAKKYDVEAWFPGLQEFRELVSCSNCTDYQSRAMETRFGFKKQGDREKKYVHMLNSTLCATERTICCILENYQTPEGIRVPDALKPYMFGLEILPYINPTPEIKEPGGKGKKKGGHTTQD